MDIREPHSIFKLFVESFNVTNKLFGRFILIFVLCLVGGIALAVLSAIAHFPYIVTSLLGNIYTVFLSVVLFKAIAAQAEEERTSLFDLIAASPLPAIFLVVLSLILGLLGLVAGIVTAIFLPLIAPLLPHVVTVAVLIGIALLILFLYVRLGFTPLAIILRDQGPIHALMYSWRVTSGHFFAVLLTLILSAIFPFLCMAAIGYAIYVGIPLYFADSFDITHLTLPWIMAFVGVFIIYGFLCLSMVTYWVLVFLNLSYTADNPSSSAEAVSPHAFEKGAALPTSAAAVFQNTTPQNVQVLKASVKTHENDETLSEHLGQVYQPQPETQFTQTEEDRMPTIVFDDEMASQMAKDRARWEEEKNKARQKHQPGNDSGGSVKMSK